MASPVFAHRLVLLANLARGATPRISTVAQATSALGLENLKPLLLGLIAYDVKSPTISRSQQTFTADPLSLRDLWEHALASAMIAAKLTAKLTEVAPLQAFIAGLIHDIGRLLLWRYSAAEFAAAVTLARDQRLAITDAEARTLGIDHTVLGEAWCGKYEIAAPLAAVVRRHHDSITTLQASSADGVARLISVIQAGESLADTKPIGLIDEDLPDDSGSRSALGLGGKADWVDTAAEVQSTVASLREAFGFSRFDRVKPGFYQREMAQAIPDERSTSPRRDPASRAQVIPLPVSSETAHRLESRTAAEKLVVLVVEDHGSLCDMVRMFLIRHGYQVRTANNGATALDILAHDEIHMVLLDLMLPQVDGFEVLRQIHKARQEMLPYIIVVSAGAADRDRKKVLDLGANEYMPKPFNLARLLERVQAVEKYLL